MKNLHSNLSLTDIDGQKKAIQELFKNISVPYEDLKVENAPTDKYLDTSFLGKIIDEKSIYRKSVKTVDKTSITTMKQIHGKCKRSDFQDVVTVIQKKTKKKLVTFKNVSIGKYFMPSAKSKEVSPISTIEKRESLSQPAEAKNPFKCHNPFDSQESVSTLVSTVYESSCQEVLPKLKRSKQRQKNKFKFSNIAMGSKSFQKRC